MTMEIFNITVPIYAQDRKEAAEAQKALYSFIERHRDKNIAVTGAKIVRAMGCLDGNGFIARQIENFLRG